MAHQFALKDLSATYAGQQEWIVKGIELTAKSGEALGIIGRAGVEVDRQRGLLPQRRL